MTRARLIFALVLSIVLVGGAGWIRLSRASTVHVANLLPIGGQNGMDYEANVRDVVETLSTPSEVTASTTPQTDTSLISRQLFGDFFGMVSNGQVTDENVAALATQYADSIGNLDKSTRVSPTDLTVVADTEDNSVAYLDNLNTIYDKYEALVKAESTKVSNFQKVDAAFLAWAGKMEGLYGQEAAELKTIPVPASVLEAHTKLVNNHLSSKAAMHYLTLAQSDPASAMGAIIVQGRNAQEEQDILSSIEGVMRKNGIISSNP